MFYCIQCIFMEQSDHKNAILQMLLKEKGIKS